MKRYLLYILFVVFIQSVSAQTNPFLTPDDNADTVTVQQTVKKRNSGLQIPLLNQFIKKNAEFQRIIKHKLSSLARDYKSTESVKAIMVLFFLAFIYGILHSMGPGHGKIFIFSYILTERPNIKRAVFISYAIATVHAMSGLLVAVIILFVLEKFTSMYWENSNISVLMTQISYLIMIFIGAWLFYRILAGKQHSHSHSHDIPQNSWKQTLPFVLSTGIVPCPGTIIIVTYLASMNLFNVGLASVFFIILGMGITIFIIGLIAIFSKQLVLKITSIDSKSYTKIYQWVSAIGALFLVLFGIAFFMGSFNV